MTFSRLVAAIDGSDQAQRALGFAFALTAGTGAQVTLAHVVEVPDPYPELPQLAPGIERLIEMEEGEWGERLASLAADAPEGTSVSTEVLVASRPVPALLELVGDRRADLLVAGTHGTGGIRRMVLGSVSQHLLEHAPCSTLLVGEGPPAGMPRSVVAGIDGSAASAAVVAAAQSAAAALSAPLVLVHVAEPLVPGDRSIESRHAVRAWEREQGRRILDEARAGLTAPLETVEEEVREGRPWEQLIAVCAERRAALAVVGSTGRHHFAGLLLGSTTRHLAHAAPCPVLSVRTGPPGSGPPGTR